MFNYELERGYTTCPRSIDKLSEELCKIFKHLLAKATYAPRGELETGQVMTTINQLRTHHRSMNFTKWKMEDCLQKLEGLELITWQRGGRKIPSVITILNYDMLQKPANYGKKRPTLNQPYSNSKPTLNRPDNANDINDLNHDANSKPTLNQPYSNSKPTSIRKNNIISNKKEPESFHDPTTTLLSKMQEFVEIRKADFPNEDARKYIPHERDPFIIEKLLNDFSENQILENWEMFVIDPARVFYKSRPITLHLFQRAIFEEQAANKPAKINVFKQLRENMK